LACLADEGHIYGVDKGIPDHPNGRCTGVPVVKGMPEPTWLMGEDWFDMQPEDVQRGIMGPARFEAWQDEKVYLSDMGTTTYDPVWGGGLTTRSLVELGLVERAAVSEVVGPMTEKQWQDSIWGRPGSVLLTPETSDERMTEWLRKGLPLGEKGDQKAKDEIVTSLSERTGIPYDDVNDFIAQWAHSSNDEDMRSLAMQRDAANLLDQDLPYWQQRKILDIMRKRQRQMELLGREAGLTRGQATQRIARVYPEYNSLLDSDTQQKLLREMYDMTQERLDQEGIGGTIRLRRGMTVSQAQFDKWEAQAQANGTSLLSGNDTLTVDYSGSVLESWSTEFSTAAEFAYPRTGKVGIVFEMDIPRERLIGSARSGFGCLNEFEFIHLGAYGDEDARIMFVRTGRSMGP